MINVWKKYQPDRVAWSNPFPAAKVKCNADWAVMAFGSAAEVEVPADPLASERGNTSLLLFATKIAWLSRSIIVTTAD